MAIARGNSRIRMANIVDLWIGPTQPSDPIKYPYWDDTSGLMPGVPQGPYVTAGDTVAILHSGIADNASSYNAYWTNDGSTPTKTHGTKITGVTDGQTHSGLTNGVTYRYVFTGVNSIGESAESTIVTTTPYVGGYYLNIPCEGSEGSQAFVDISDPNNPKTVTAIGNVAMTTSQHVTGSSCAGGFAQGNNALSVPYSGSVIFGGADFTIDFYYRPTVLPTSYQYALIGRGHSLVGWYIMLYNDGTIIYSPGANVASIQNPHNMSIDTWYRIRLIYRFNGTPTTSLYVDDNLIGTTTDEISDHSDALLIGKWYYNNNYNAAGYFDDIKISMP